MFVATILMLAADPALGAALARGLSDRADCAVTLTERTVLTDEGSGEIEEEGTRVTAYAPGAGWTLRSVDGAPPDTEALAAFAEEERDPPGEGSSLEGLGLTGFTFAKSGEGTYVARDWPEPVLDALAAEDKMLRRVAKRSDLRVTLADDGEGGHRIASRSIVLREAFRVKMIVKIHAFDITQEYGEVDGHLLPVRDVATGRFALAGDVGLSETVVTYTDYACAGAAPAD